MQFIVSYYSSFNLNGYQFMQGFMNGYGPALKKIAQLAEKLHQKQGECFIKPAA